MTVCALPDRRIIAITGEDARAFLQGLITNDIQKLRSDALLYSVLLTPQGKLLAEFFLLAEGESILLDVPLRQAESLLKKLTMYKLRAKVHITLMPDRIVEAAWQEKPQGEGWLTDPRHPNLGWRRIVSGNVADGDAPDIYTSHRITLGIPDYHDWVPDRSFPMEMGVRDLHGISDTKGCYVGQEIVARTRTRGTLRKAVHHVIAIESHSLPKPDSLVMLDDKMAGVLRSTSGKKGLAILNFDMVEHATGNIALTADGIPIQAALPIWFARPSQTETNSLHPSYDHT